MRYIVSAGALAVMSVSLLAGCASRPEDVPASYIPARAYESYSCRQLQDEAEVVASRGAAAAGIQHEKARNDEIATAVTVVVFLPAALFIKGDGANAAELSRLKGQADAIEEASIRKNCRIDFRRG